MGRYVGRIINPISGKIESVSYEGYTFKVTDESLKRWKRWMRFVHIDQGVIFWFFGLVTLFLLSVNASAVLGPLGLVPEGLDVAVVQAHIFGENWGAWGFNLFLVMSFLMLFSVMWTVIDAFTRIASDIIYVNSRIGPFRKHLHFLKNVSLSHLYYTLIVGIIIVNALLLPLEQPLTLLTISAILGGLTMAIYTPIIIYLNNFKLPPQLRPHFITNVIMVIASLFYGFFSLYIVLDFIA